MNVADIAKACEVEEQDVLNLIRYVTDALIKDGMAKIFIDADQSMRADIMHAYIASEIRKFKEFCMTLLTNTEKRNAFDEYMYQMLRAS